jgi:hypothetical protein
MNADTILNLKILVHGPLMKASSACVLEQVPESSYAQEMKPAGTRKTLVSQGLQTI